MHHNPPQRTQVQLNTLIEAAVELLVHTLHMDEVVVDTHLILCDLRMPELDGPGLYQAVAARQPHLLPRFVFLTGDTLSPEANRFLEQSGVPRLIKPFSATEGRRVVRQALSVPH